MPRSSTKGAKGLGGATDGFLFMRAATLTLARLPLMNFQNTLVLPTPAPICGSYRVPFLLRRQPQAKVFRASIIQL